MKTLIQIGAGNIGRACLGRLFHHLGYYIYFSDVNTELLDRLSSKKEYKVRLLAHGVDRIDTINSVDKMPTDEKDLNKIYSEVSIITTAVGVSILPKIVPTVLKVINYRFTHSINEPLNILACENTVHASSILKNIVFESLSDEVKNWINGKISFVDVAIDSIVPNIKSEDPLLVTGEDFAELVIDKDTFLGEFKDTESIYVKSNLEAYIERKLFTLNTGHAITAYLGYEKGLNTIDEAIENKEVLDIVLSAIKESGEVLIKKYGFDRDTHNKYIEKIISRFRNPFLKDNVARVGREPMRKLSFNDRLIKPLRYTYEYKLEHKGLLCGIVSALMFYDENDKESVVLKETINSIGIDKALVEITGLDSTSILVKEILDLYKSVKK